MPNLPHGTVTFLFTDIEGSTRLWQAHHDAMSDAYARHDAILREAIEAQGGVVYKTIGDAFQVAFPTAPGAVDAALTAQQALQAEPWTLPEPLRVRMALHTGAVDPDPDGDYRSPVLNRLGRLLVAGHGGQVLLSLATQELSRDHLPTSATLRDLGEQRLKDLYRPERVYQLGHPTLAGDFPPLRTLDRRPNNLPVQPTQFIGREAEVAAVRTLLARDDVRLVTIAGPGGMGKTRLSLQVAADLLDAFSDGVFVVELAALTDPDLVPGTIAQALTVPEEPGTPITTTLTGHLKERKLMLVLDNLEQVIDAASYIGTLLAACPLLKVLVTSRIRLGLRGEREFPLPPLALPDPKRLPSVAVLSQYEAVRLFLERAQDVKPSFAVTNANAPAVAEICVRLDGLPLAIELAAARIRMLPPEALLKRLASRLRLLTGGAQDLPVRQQTLRAAIAWSYELLALDEQVLFRRLAVFAGGSSVEAVEAVAAGNELGLDIFDGLERLVDHSLVRQTKTAGEPRFVMLETIREYGLEQLEAHGELWEARQRHVACFVALAEQDEAELTGSDLEAWFDRLETEHDNIRAACSWALEHDVAAALRIIGYVGKFWLRRGHVRDGGGWLERALATPAPDVAVSDRARVLRWASHHAQLRNDFGRADTWGHEALVLYRTLGDRRHAVMMLSALAVTADMQGDIDQAMKLFGEAVTLARTLADSGVRCRVLNTVGYTAYLHGDLELARTYLAEAVTLARIHDYTELATVLHSYAEVTRASGDVPHAEAFYRESLGIAGRRKQRLLILEALQGLGATAVLAQRALQAARLFGVEAMLRETWGNTLDPGIVTDYEHHLALTREALSKQAFAAAWEAGAALSLDDAIQEALAETGDPSDAPG